MKAKITLIGILLVAIFLWDFAFYSMETTLSSFGVFSLGLTPGQASIATSAFGVSLILFSIPAGFFGGRFGRVATVNIGSFGSFILIFAGFFLVHGAVPVRTALQWA